MYSLRYLKTKQVRETNLERHAVSISLLRNKKKSTTSFSIEIKCAYHNFDNKTMDWFAYVILSICIFQWMENSFPTVFGIDIPLYLLKF